MVYLPTFGVIFMVNVGKYTIHGSSGIGNTSSTGGCSIVILVFGKYCFFQGTFGWESIPRKK